LAEIQKEIVGGTGFDICETPTRGRLL